MSQLCPALRWIGGRVLTHSNNFPSLLLQIYKNVITRNQPAEDISALPTDNICFLPPSVTNMGPLIDDLIAEIRLLL